MCVFNIIKLKHCIKGREEAREGGGREHGRKGRPKEGGKTFPYKQCRLETESSTTHWLLKNERHLDTWPSLRCWITIDKSWVYFAKIISMLLKELIVSGKYLLNLKQAKLQMKF